MQANLPSQQKLLQQVHHLINSNQMEQAWKFCQQLVKQYPKFADAWMAKSFVALRLNDHEQAVVAINKAIRLAPNQAGFKFNKVMLLERIGQVAKALALGKDLVASNLKDKQLTLALITFFNKYQKYNLVEKCYRKLLTVEPENQELLFNLATVTLFLGDLDEADKLATEAIRGNDFDSDIHFFRSHLKKQSSSSNHIQELKQFAERAIKDPVRKAKTYYALAKELEDCEEYAESFKFRQAGAEIYRNKLNYDFNDEINFIRALRQTYDSSLIKDKLHSQSGKNESNKPIFVVGLPRTGTTLLERIVSSHSQVASAGELTHFSRLMSAGMEKLSLDPSLSRSQMVSASTQLDFSQLGQLYLEATRTLAGNKSRLIDKFPQNALYIGLIHLALPQAKILLLERHPLDVCYSVYKQLFTDAFHFSYDLEELAEYFYEHQLLMSHWQQVLPEVVKTVRYEDLVNNLEHSAKSVIDFCGLDWEDSCLEFHKNKQASTTASASQVRQKVYSSSIGMWKNYKKELQPLITKLESYGCLEGWEY
ncbi:MAG: sulfotransferase [Kangiella sp.]|nr:sulfotransferase [Kangiella sp.]MCW9027611.1 sulfotransferase [Kangiella sp.]